MMTALMLLGFAAASFALGTMLIVAHPFARAGSALLVAGCAFLFVAFSTWRNRGRGA
jgi:hypothetical protein